MCEEVLQQDCDVKGDESIFRCHGKTPKLLRLDKHGYADDSGARRPASRSTIRGLIQDHAAAVRPPLILDLIIRFSFSVL